MDQLQCPNCGGFKNEDKIEYLNLAGGKVLVPGCNTWIVAFLMAGIVWAGCAFLADLVGLTKSETTRNAVQLAIAVLSFVVFLFLLIGGYHGGNKSVKEAIKIHNLECRLCGYKWRWQEGTPYPTVTLRPDLIAKGEQELERKARELRDAEGAFWLNQQRSK